MNTLQSLTGIFFINLISTYLHHIWDMEIKIFLIKLNYFHEIEKLNCRMDQNITSNANYFECLKSLLVEILFTNGARNLSFQSLA